MQYTVLALLLFVAVTLAISSRSSRVETVGTARPGFRLISINETTREWLSPAQVDSLLVQGTKFMDETDHQWRPAQALFNVDPLPTEIQHKTLVDQYIPQIEKSNLESTLKTFESFNNRYYTSPTGLSSSQWLIEQFIRNSAGRGDIQVIAFNHTWAQKSVIARILGTNEKAGTRVVLGAHIDSINVRSVNRATARAPGADDDGSGSVCILEAFRVLAQSGFKPQYTLEFQGYAAEEVGLLGSQDIAEQYFQDAIPVQAMMQFDMMGWNGADKNSGIVPSVYLDYTNPELSSFLEKLLDTYTTLGYKGSRCGYACSDHASYHKYGYRASFAAEGGGYPYIHTANDLSEHLDFDKMTEFVKMAVGYAVEVGLPAESK